MVTADDVLTFWFDEHPSQWFDGDAAFDAEVRAKFHDTLNQAARGELDAAWSANPRHRLALIIVLDQFSRQIHRGNAAAFAQDHRALALAQEGMRLGQDQGLSTAEKMFFYLPFMHAEDAALQERSVTLAQGLGNIDFAVKHRDVIERFGRFPRRNQALGRRTTPEEQKYLDDGGAF